MGGPGTQTPLKAPINGTHNFLGSPIVVAIVGGLHFFDLLGGLGGGEGFYGGRGSLSKPGLQGPL